MQDLVIETLEAQGVPYVDLLAPLRSEVARRSEAGWFYDEVHLHKDGHRAVGALLASTVRERFPHVAASPNP